MTRLLISAFVMCATTLTQAYDARENGETNPCVLARTMAGVAPSSGCRTLAVKLLQDDLELDATIISVSVGSQSFGDAIVGIDTKFLLLPTGRALPLGRFPQGAMRLSDRIYGQLGYDLRSAGGSVRTDSSLLFFDGIASQR
jgi:hypothetical protein